MAAPTARVDAFGEGARTLVETTVLWLTRETSTALIALGIAAGIFFALSAARRLLAPARIAEGAPPRRLGWGGIVRRLAARTKDYFLAILSLQLVATWVGVPELLGRTFATLFTIAAVIQGAVWLRALALALIERRATGREDAGQLASALGIVRLLVSVVIWALAIILILDNLGVNVTALIAGLGVGGIAIGLAAQGIFSDLFAALSIIFDRPFSRGDNINFGDTWGTVEAIGLKTTRIRSLTGEQIVVSNSNLLNKELRNFARLERRRVSMELGIVYQISPEQAAAIPGMLREIVESDPRCAFVRAGLTGFGDSALDFQLQFDVITTSYDEMYEERHRVAVAILTRFAAERIAFAYPTTVSFTAAPDGNVIDPREIATQPTEVEAPPAPTPLRARVTRALTGRG